MKTTTIAKDDPYVLTINVDVSPESPDHKRISDWLTANGITATEVPVTATVNVTPDSIVYERFLKDAKGHMYVDRDADGRPILDVDGNSNMAMERVTVPRIA